MVIRDKGENMNAMWAGVSGELAKHVEAQTNQCLAAYRAKPNLIEQDAGIEISNVEGGYGRKQLHELVQNAADALVGNQVELLLCWRIESCIAPTKDSPSPRAVSKP